MKRERKKVENCQISSGIMNIYTYDSHFSCRQPTNPLHWAK